MLLQKLYTTLPVLIAFSLLLTYADDNEIAAAIAAMITKAANEVADANPGKDGHESEACGLLKQVFNKVLTTTPPTMVKPEKLPVVALVKMQDWLQEDGVSGRKNYLSRLQEQEIVTMWASQVTAMNPKPTADKLGLCNQEKDERAESVTFENSIGTGRYKEPVFLGAGENGRVYLVKDDDRNKQEMALKTSTDNLDNEFDIARLFADTDYGLPEAFRFVPKVYDKGVAKLNTDFRYLTMDVVGTSWETAEKERLLDDNSTKKLIARLFQILKMIHSKSLAHGDAHPGNLAFAREPNALNRLFLIDYGFCSKEMKNGRFNMAARDFQYIRMTIRDLNKERNDEFISKALMKKLDDAFPWRVITDGKPAVLFPFFSLKEKHIETIQKEMEKVFKEWMTETLFKAGDLKSTVPLVDARDPKTVVGLLFDKESHQALNCNDGKAFKGFKGTMGPFKHTKGTAEVTFDIRGNCKACGTYGGPVQISVSYTFSVPHPVKLSFKRVTKMTSPADNKEVQKRAEAIAQMYVNERLLEKGNSLGSTCR